jgi:hypothetical protein
MMRRMLCLTLVVLAAVACTDDSSKPSSSSASASSGPPVIKPTATLTLEGDGPLSTTVTASDIRCQFPDINGQSIAVLVDLTDDTTLRLSLFPKKVVAKVSTGTGSSYAERDFEGTGVSDFDVLTGGQLDGTMQEVPVPGGAGKGSVGALTAVRGSVSCGNQRPGTSTVALTGDLGDVHPDRTGLVDPRVECNDADNEIVVLGVLSGDTVKYLVELGLHQDGTTLTLYDANGGQRRFNGPSTGAKSQDKQAAFELDLVEQATESPLPTLHVSGSVTCGTPVG